MRVRLHDLILGPCAATVIVALLCAPLGWSFVLAALVTAFCTAYIAIHEQWPFVPWRWLLVIALLVVYVILHLVVATVLLAPGGEFAVHAAVMIIAAIFAYVIGFALGSAVPRAVAAAVVAYLGIRLATSAFIPTISARLPALLEGLYRYEDYRALNLGVRLILPGDMAILAAWLFAATAIRNPGWSAVARLVALACAIASLSRFFVVAIVVLEVVRGLAAARLRTFALRLLILSLLTAGATYAVFRVVGFDNVDTLVATRVAAESSTAEKLDQIEIFLDRTVFEPINLFAGAGIGSFIQHHIRDQDNPFQYEVQWLALLYQLGLPGFLLLILVLVTPFLYVFTRIRRQCKPEVWWTVLAAGGFFIAGGFVNPFLLLPQNFVLYAVLGRLNAMHTGNAGSRNLVNAATRSPATQT